MQFSIERHAYAPELNRVVFPNGASMPAPGCTTIRQAREKYFAPVKVGRAVSVHVQYAVYVLQNRVYTGRVESYKVLKQKLHQIRAWHNLPERTITVKTKLIG